MRRSRNARPFPPFHEWMTEAQHIDPNTLSATDRDEWERLYECVRARAAGPPNGQDLQREYFRTALEYYIAARFSAFSFFMPMSGVLFHHGIALYLKGLLCPWLNEEQRKALSHVLPSAWEKYKSFAADPALSRFDDLVAELDQHWRVRYPDDLVKHGLQTDTLVTRDLLDRLDDSAVRGTPRNPMPRAEVINKARDLITPILGREKSERLIETVYEIEKVTDVRKLRPLLQLG